MAVICLSGLPAPKEFDTVGEPAALQQRWAIWKTEFELFCAASVIKDAKQQRALLGYASFLKVFPTTRKAKRKTTRRLWTP